MTQILQYNQIDRQQWAELVQTSETGTWFQSPEAYDFFASLPDIFTPFVVGIGRPILRAICVGYVTKDPNPLKQYFTRRAIIIGGPCLADDCSNEEVSALMNAVKNHLSFTPSFIHPSSSRPEISTIFPHGVRRSKRQDLPTGRISIFMSQPMALRTG